MNTIALSLISHTNAGKTTLARTLLGRDIGEVRDAPHVTEFAEDHPLVVEGGEQLVLWDTPGFGDSVRLVKRLKGAGNPVGWFLSEVWDRFSDRAFYLSQQAMKNVRDRADVVLYMVDASQSPAAAGYIPSEMALLAWMNKPVLVLLNQLGDARSPADEAADVGRWCDHLRTYEHVREVLPLDAFSRCWVQEFVWLEAVERALPESQRGAMRRLRRAWMHRRWDSFDAAMSELATSLARVSAQRAPVPESEGMKGTLKQLGSAVSSLWRQATAARGEGAEGGATSQAPPLPPEAEAARKALAKQADDEFRACTGRLIELHGLSGQAQSELDALIHQHFDIKLRVNEGKAAVVGGAVTGALGGLVADVGSGGITLGGGMLTGAVLGALAAAGAARGVNMMRGRQQSWLTWSAPAMDAMVEAALLRYLAVAHFGRGRGEWQRGATPEHWRAVVQDALTAQRGAWAAVWADVAQRRDQIDATPTATPEGTPSTPASTMVSPATMLPLLREATLHTLKRLYPSFDGVRDALDQPAAKPSSTLAPLGDPA